MASQHQLSSDGAAVAPRTPAKIAECAQIIAFLLPPATPPVIAMCCGGDGEVAARLVGRLGSSQIARFAVLQRGKKSPWRAWRGGEAVLAREWTKELTNTTDPDLRKLHIQFAAC